MKRSLFSLFLMITHGIILGQGFSYVSPEQGVAVYNVSPFFGSGISLFDFDGDGWDDLTFPLENDSLRLYRNNFGSFEALPSPYFCPGDAKQATWADYDNDGDPDLLLTVYLGTTKLFRNNGDLTFTDVSNTSGIPQQDGGRAFGASWYDYDKDGHLDVYICNYNILSSLGSNWLLHNNGDGTFTDVASDLGVDDGLQLSFQSVWMDYNNDGWGDLLVINDKENMANALFENNGDGTFTDVSELSGADILIDAMTATVGDFDKNGFQDIYCTNEAEGNVLLSNNGDGTFTDLAASAGVLCDALTWGSVFLDMEHDRDEDLYVAGTGFGPGNLNFFFENMADSTFTLFTDPGVTDLLISSYGVAKGDWNDDGFWDFGVANSGSQPASLFENDGGSNHWLKISLEGVVSHHEAIGTWLSCYSEGLEERIWTMSGENYLGQDSPYEIFSLGSASTVDSLSVLWPSGLEEWLYDLPVDQRIHLTEGFSLSTFIFTSTQQSLFCEGQAFGAEVQGEGDVIWMDGVTGAYRVISESGSYYATLITPEGFPVASDTLTVEFTPVNSLEVVSPAIACHGETTTIDLVTDGTVPVDNVIWNEGELEGLVLENVGPGTYQYLLTDVNGCIQDGSVTVSEPPPITLELSVINILCAGDSTGSIEPMASGGTGELFLSGICMELPCPAGEYLITVTDANNCTLDSMVTISEPDPINISIDAQATLDDDGSCTATVEGGVPPYTLLWNTGENGLDISGLTPGIYSLWVVDSNNCLAFAAVEVEQLLGLDHSESWFNHPYPVPFRDHLYTASRMDCYARLLDTSGRSILHEYLTPGKALDTGSLSPGTYVLILETREGIVQRYTVNK